MKNIAAMDAQIHQAITDEIQRQRNTLELIASENFVSAAVLEVQGSVFTNKYAEGYSGKRYYGGCHNVDTAETLAIKRAKEIFAAEHVNVQPHSGTQANVAVYNTVLKPGDTIMGMNLSHGGHLTHGSPVNYSGYTYNVMPYGVNKDTELIDYEELEKLATECSPKLIVVGASAYSRFIDYQRFRHIADKHNAKLLVDIAHPAGLIAAKVHPSPIDCAEFVTTTTHKTLRGPRGGMIMCQKQFAKQIDKSIFPGIQGGPLMHVIAAKAVAFKEALESDFVVYQKQVISNAKTLAQSLQQRGFKIVSDGTDTHLFLINLLDKEISGKQAEESLEKAYITTNKNTVPFETKSPFVTSGIRIGTPAITTRGMKEQQMQSIGDMIANVLLDIDNKDVQENVKKQVEKLCKQFPLYTDLN